MQPIDRPQRLARAFAPGVALLPPGTPAQTADEARLLAQNPAPLKEITVTSTRTEIEVGATPPTP